MKTKKTLHFGPFLPIFEQPRIFLEHRDHCPPTISLGRGGEPGFQPKIRGWGKTIFKNQGGGSVRKGES